MDPIDATTYITSMAVMATARITPRLTPWPKVSAELANRCHPPLDCLAFCCLMEQPPLHSQRPRGTRHGNPNRSRETCAMA